jgi:hypothetical protein
MMMSVKERHESDVRDAVRQLFPNALLRDDGDGMLVIHTNCMWTGKTGQAVIGNMNIEGDTPEWEEA